MISIPFVSISEQLFYCIFRSEVRGVIESNIMEQLPLTKKVGDENRRNSA